MIYYFKDDILGQTRTFIRILFGNNQLEQAWAELKLATHALPTRACQIKVKIHFS